MYLKLETIEAAAKLQASVTNKFVYYFIFVYLSSYKDNVSTHALNLRNGFTKWVMITISNNQIDVCCFKIIHERKNTKKRKQIKLTTWFF